MSAWNPNKPTCTATAGTKCSYDEFCCCPMESVASDRICQMVNNLICTSGSWVYQETTPPKCITDPQNFRCKSAPAATSCVTCPTVLPDCDSSCVAPKYCDYKDRTCDTCHSATCTAPIDCTASMLAQCTAVTCKSEFDQVEWTAPGSCCKQCIPRECKAHTDCASAFCMKQIGDCNGGGICVPPPDSSVCASLTQDNRPYCNCKGIQVTGMCSSHSTRVNVAFEGFCPTTTTSTPGFTTKASTTSATTSTTWAPTTTSTTTARAPTTTTTTAATRAGQTTTTTTTPRPTGTTTSTTFQPPQTTTTTSTTFQPPQTTTTTFIPRPTTTTASATRGFIPATAAATTTTTTTTTTQAPVTTTSTTRAPQTTSRGPVDCSYSVNCNGVPCSGACNGGTGVQQCNVVGFVPPVNGGRCDVDPNSMRKQVQCVNNDPCNAPVDCTFERDCSKAVCNGACGGGVGWKECVVSKFVPARNGGTCKKAGNGEIITRTCINNATCPDACSYTLNCTGACKGPCGGQSGTTMCIVKNFRPAAAGASCDLPAGASNNMLIPQTCRTDSCKTPKDCVVTVDCSNKPCNGACGGGFGTRTCAVKDFVPAETGGYCSVSGREQEISQPCQNSDPCPATAPSMMGGESMKEVVMAPTDSEAVLFSSHSAMFGIQGLRHPTPEIKEFAFHIYWHQNNVADFGKAMVIREALLKTVERGDIVAVFDGVTSSMIKGLKMSSIPRIDLAPRGPHPAAHLEVWVPSEYLAKAMSFFMLYRGELSVLHHPFTRWELEDFSGCAVWLGPVWRLDLSSLKLDKGTAPMQYPELGLGYSAATKKT
eukprot:gb/GEZN01001390.1/.p1 GENE.gb/GEZN01001390.1/~~gb/GEZN01001390.1/.p1  ORF type:complete len:919 (+),score=148.60 gb/GEZN01001390.1/:297-2759(+)